MKKALRYISDNLWAICFITAMALTLLSPFIEHWRDVLAWFGY